MWARAKRVELGMLRKTLVCAVDVAQVWAVEGSKARVYCRPLDTEREPRLVEEGEDCHLGAHSMSLWE